MIEFATFKIWIGFIWTSYKKAFPATFHGFSTESVRYMFSPLTECNVYRPKTRHVQPYDYGRPIKVPSMVLFFYIKFEIII